MGIIIDEDYSISYGSDYDDIDIPIELENPTDIDHTSNPLNIAMIIKELRKIDFSDFDFAHHTDGSIKIYINTIRPEEFDESE